MKLGRRLAKERRKAKEKIVTITKDGLLLDKVEFKKHLVTVEFKHMEKDRAMGLLLLPQEMAQAIINDFEINESMQNFNVLEDKPAAVTGLPGFRLVYAYRLDGTLQYQCIYYGFRKGDLFYSIRYSAPGRHYFDTNAGTFEQIVKSLTLEG